MNTRLVNTRLLILSGLLICLASGRSHAQGFFREYPFSTFMDGGAQSIFPHADGSYRLTAASFPDLVPIAGLFSLEVDSKGYLTDGDTSLVSYNDLSGDGLFLLENGDYLKTSFNFTNRNQITLNRFNASGALQWTTDHVFQGNDFATVIVARPNSAGEIFVHGYLYRDSVLGQDTFLVYSGYLLKYAPGGALLWETVYDYEPTYVNPSALIPTADGGCLLNDWSFMLPNDPFGEKIVRFAANGDYMWQYRPPNGRIFPHTSGKIMAENAAQETWVFVRKIPNSSMLRVDKLDAAGTLLDSVNISGLLGIDNLEGKLMLPTNDGGLLVIVQRYQLNAWYQYVLKLNADGSLAWQRPLTFLSDGVPTTFSDAKELADGSLTLFGMQGSLVLIKMSSDGIIYPHTVSGLVARDPSFNCFVDFSSPPLNGWTLHATGNGNSYYASSDATGQYTISDLDTGAYQIVLHPPSYLWQICADTVPIQFAGSTPQTETVDFAVESLYDCPLMQVDIGTAILRRCMPSTYTVQYCNVGNQPAEPARVTVSLDPLIHFDSASIPFVQNGQLIQFDLGNVEPGVCSSFQLFVKVSCDAMLGQTFCVEAHITPDTICASNLPGWSGAQIEVSARCDGDSVRFTIENTGTNAMPQSRDFIIVDDHVITRQGNFQLSPGGTHTETVPANGNTWRLIAQQEPGYPFGDTKPTVGIEACTGPGGGNFETGFLNQFPNFSGNPFDDMDCRDVIGSYDPNDKQAFPIGLHNEHEIEPNQPIDYLIRFQNTGTDTAFTVVLRDTLSLALDPASIRPGAASHPYTWSLSGNGILTFVFPNILLPDSSTNEAASHGFAQFRINQRRDNPRNTLIENRAGIYFDFNTVVLTNTVFHRVAKDFLQAAPKGPEALPQLKVWPNPANEQLEVELIDLFHKGQQLVVYDVLGRRVRTVAVHQETLTLRRDGLPDGLYWLELRDGNRLIAVGTAVLQR